MRTAISGWLYRRLLMLLPKSLRATFGEEMLVLFLIRLREARGGRVVVQVWLRAVVDVMAVAFSERFQGKVMAAGEARGARGSLDLFPEIRQALRALLRSPGYALTSVLMLGVGIGTVTALFSVVNGVLLRPLPHRDADRLVLINSPYLTLENVQEWRRPRGVLEAAASYSLLGVTAATPNGAISVRSMPVGVGFFELIGARAIQGRTFVAGDHVADAPPSVLVGEDFWLAHFGGGAVAGRTITLDERVYGIVGVMPRAFSFRYEDIALWVPLEHARARGVSLAGRLAAGVTPAHARARLTPFAQSMSTPEQRKRFEHVQVEPVNVVGLFESVVGQVRRTLWILFGSAAVVLLLAAANVATLSIGRALARREELAVRSALGAGRGRIMRHLLVEAVLLALAGASLGLLLARLAPAVLRLAPDFVPRSEQIVVDSRVVFFALLSGFVAVLVFGVLPGLGVARWNESTSLWAATTRGRRAGAAQSAAVVAEIAAAFVLALSALLLVRTYAALRPTEPGFRVRDRVIASFDLPRAAYHVPERSQQFADHLVRRVSQLSTAPRAAVTTDLPLTGMTMLYPADSESAPNTRVNIHLRAVSPGYLELMEMQLLRGRALLASDGPAAQLTAVINEAAAQKFWGSAGAALGRSFTVELNEGPRQAHVVGVLRDSWIMRGPEARPEVFVPFRQLPFRRFTLVMESKPDRAITLQDLRTTVNAIDRGVPIRGFSSLEQAISWSVTVPRFQATLLGLLTGNALLLAATGCFAVLSQAMGRRTHELGIRVALGATGGIISGLVMRRAGLLAVAGIVLGAITARIVTRVLESYLYGVTPTDTATFLAAAALLGAVVLAAAWPTAHRVARIDPLVALKHNPG
jgi:predicted permease